MTVELNGIAHIQLTVNDPERCCAFWEKLCHFFEMKTLIKSDQMVYCIGSRTGVLVRASTPEHRATRFERKRPEVLVIEPHHVEDVIAVRVPGHLAVEDHVLRRQPRDGGCDGGKVLRQSVARVQPHLGAVLEREEPDPVELALEDPLGAD